MFFFTSALYGGLNQTAFLFLFPEGFVWLFSNNFKDKCLDTFCLDIYIYIYIYICMLCICIKVYIYRQKNDIYTLYFGLFQTLICNYAFICIDIYYNMYIMLYIKKLKMKSKTSAKTYLNLKYIFR